MADFVNHCMYTGFITLMRKKGSLSKEVAIPVRRSLPATKVGVTKVKQGFYEHTNQPVNMDHKERRSYLPPYHHKEKREEGSTDRSETNHKVSEELHPHQGTFPYPIYKVH